MSAVVHPKKSDETYKPYKLALESADADTVTPIDLRADDAVATVGDDGIEKMSGQGLEGRKNSNLRRQRTIKSQLQTAFESIDKDHNGVIDNCELAGLARSQGHNVSDQQMSEIISKLVAKGDISLDDDDNTLNFEEFMLVMDDIQDKNHDGLISFDEIASHLISRTLRRYAAPEYENMKPHGLRYNVAMALDGSTANIVVMILIVLDVGVTALELALVATQCNPESQAQHDWNHNLHITTLTILWLLAVQLFALMGCYGCRFFQRLSYMVDTIIVFAAIAMEHLHVQGGPLFVVMLGWRMLRVMHGIVTSVEKQVHLTHMRVKQAEERHLDTHDKHNAHLDIIGELCRERLSHFTRVHELMTSDASKEPHRGWCEVAEVAKEFESMHSGLLGIQEELMILHASSLHVAATRNNDKHS
jgi:hypothetical protein